MQGESSLLMAFKYHLFESIYDEFSFDVPRSTNIAKILFTRENGRPRFGVFFFRILNPAENALG